MIPRRAAGRNGKQQYQARHEPRTGAGAFALVADAPLYLRKRRNAEELPIAIETIFAVLVHRAWTGNLSALILVPKSAVSAMKLGE